MKILSSILLISAGFALADQPVRPAAPAAAKTATKAPLRIPPDAVAVSPGLYRWTDKDGKTWMYRGTPFGVSRWAEDEDDSKQRVIMDQTTAVEQGDSIRFERPTPFGPRTWTRKKADLDETEQRIWANQQRKNSGGSDKPEKE